MSTSPESKLVMTVEREKLACKKAETSKQTPVLGEHLSAWAVGLRDMYLIINMRYFYLSLCVSVPLYFCSPTVQRELFQCLTKMLSFICLYITNKDSVDTKYAVLNKSDCLLQIKLNSFTYSWNNLSIRKL